MKSFQKSSLTPTKFCKGLENSDFRRLKMVTNKGVCVVREQDTLRPLQFEGVPQAEGKERCGHELARRDGRRRRRPGR